MIPGRWRLCASELQSTHSLCVKYSTSALGRTSASPGRGRLIASGLASHPPPARKVQHVVCDGRHVRVPPDPGVFFQVQGRKLPGMAGAGANANAAGAIAWTKLNSKLYSILFFATEESVTTTVKQFQARPQARQKADGVGVWEALSVRFDGNTKEARRACREKLTHASMKSGEDPTDFFAKLDEQRLRLVDMGETLTDESYEDIILRALPKGYDYVRQQPHMNRNFGLTGIKTTAINMLIDELSRKLSASAVAGRRVAMQATQGHGKKQHYKRGKDNRKRGGGASKWCSFHRTRIHSDAECKKAAGAKRKAV